MYGNTDFATMDSLGRITYIGGPVDIEQLDSWWMQKTYIAYRVFSSRDIEGLLTALSKLSSTSGFEDLKFLFEMDEWERGEWIRRAHRQCHQEFLENSDVFPACGLHESFKRLRALRKERARMKKMKLE